MGLNFFESLSYKNDSLIDLDNLVIEIQLYVLSGIYSLYSLYCLKYVIH